MLRSLAVDSSPVTTMPADETPLPRSGDDRDSTPDQPRRIDRGTPSFADTNIAEDQRRQGRERGEGLGAGGTANRDARYPQGDGEQPEDDLD
jgi:hypothetical protein